jgi:4-hydroxybenzoate polyprenyltransferase
MSYQTYQLVLKTTPDISLLIFIFFSTICSYSFHWYLTLHSEIPSDRIGWVHKHRIVHAVLFFFGLAGSVFYFFSLLAHWFWLSVSALVTFLYSAPKIPHPYFRALRKIAIGKTIFLAIVWTYVTAVLPVIISGESWRTDAVLFTVSRFFLVYAICVLFDYRDREDDKVAGIRSMVTWFGDEGINRLFIVSIGVYVIATIWMYYYNYSIKSIILLLVPGFIVTILYNYARKHFDDLFYYFVLDGLMMFSGLLMMLLGI